MSDKVETNNKQWTREEFLTFAKQRAIEALAISKRDASMSFLSDIQKSQGTSFELYPSGHMAEFMCLYNEELGSMFLYLLYLPTILINKLYY